MLVVFCFILRPFSTLLYYITAHPTALLIELRGVQPVTKRGLVTMRQGLLLWDNVNFISQRSLLPSGEH